MPSEESQKDNKLTQQDYTALVFIVDRSGSMAGIARDMEGGISALIESQKALPGKLTVDYVRFDSYVEHVYEFANPDTVANYIKIEPRGSTALNDAVGHTIDRFGARLAQLPENLRPGKVIVAIVTDGWENASRLFTAEQVKVKVQHQTDVYGWDFLYLGANQDAVFVAEGLGISAGSALTYNTANVGAMAQTMDSYVTGTRSMGSYTFSAADRAANQ